MQHRVRDQGAAPRLVSVKSNSLGDRVGIPVRHTDTRSVAAWLQVRNSLLFRADAASRNKSYQLEKLRPICLGYNPTREKHSQSCDWFIARFTCVDAWC